MIPAVLKLAVLKKPDMHGITSFIMALNGIISAYLLIQLLWLSHIVPGSMRREMDERLSGKMSIEELREYFPAHRAAVHSVSVSQFPVYSQMIPLEYAGDCQGSLIK